MKLKKNVILRTVVDENLLIPVGEAVTEFNGVFTISPTAAVAFKGIQSGKGEKEILKDILESFDIDENTARNDLEAFLKELEQLGII